LTIQPPADAAAFEAGLMRLLANPAEARALGEAGRRHVAEHYGISTMIRAHEAAYARVLAGPKRRSA
jgi:glycosyltransferase involved in cell wall biosynthesis